MHLTLILLFASIASLDYFPGCFAEKKNYNVFVLERGTILREQTETDVEQNTERFIMPAHFELDAVDILMDFNQGFSIKYFPDKHMCLVSKLDTESSMQPSSLQTVMEQERGLLWENAQFVNQTYVIAGTLYDGLVTDTIKSHCQGAPIKWIETSNHKEESNPTQETGITLYKTAIKPRKLRTKRQFFIERCRPDDKRDACIVKYRHCYYVATCTPDNDGAGLNEGTTCPREHRYGRVTCCAPCCLNASGASSMRSHCASFRTREDVERAAGC